MVEHMERKTALSLSVAIAVVIALAGLSYWNTENLHTSDTWVQHTHLVVENLQALALSVAEVQSGQRGYILTGQESYLESYRRAREGVEGGVQKLRQLVADNPDQTQRLSDLVLLIDQRVALAQQLIDLRYAGQTEAAIQGVRSGKGSVLGEQIHDRIDAMIGAESELLIQRSVAKDALDQRVAVLTIGGDVLAVVLLLLAGMALYRESSRRRQVEEALQGNQELLLAVIDGTTDAIYVKDTQGRYLHLNSSVCKIVGKSRAELMGNDDRVLFPPDDANWVMENDRRVMDSGTTQTYEETVNINGKSHVFHSTKGPVRDAQGQVIGIFGIARNITERNAMEEALRESEERLRMVLESGLTAHLVHRDGHILYANSAAAELFGASSVADLINGPILQRVHPDYRELALERSRELDGGGRAPTLKEKLLRLDGETITAEVQTTLIYYDRRPAYCTFIRDITERERLEQERVQTQRLRAVGELSAGICHNLNNLLTGVVVPAELLQVTNGDPKVQHLAGTILEAGTRAAELVERLRLSVRGTTATDLVPVGLNQSIENMLAVTRPRWKDQPEAKGVAIEVRTSLTEVPAIKGNLSELNDLLVNLLFNAVDALPAGGRISIRTLLEGQMVRLDFADNGIGMDEPTRLRVFEPFFTTKMDVGSGLGLSTLHNSVVRWGGTVEVASAPGEGTTFTLRLPVGQEEPIAQPAPALALPARPGSVLVIEDDPIVRGVLAAVLGARHQVKDLPDGREALEQFRAGTYDVAIIDLGMPGIPGDQVAQRLQELDPAMARILFSGWELEAEDPRRRVFDFVLRKPLGDLKAFEEMIGQAIQLRDQRQGG